MLAQRPRDCIYDVFKPSGGAGLQPMAQTRVHNAFYVAGRDEASILSFLKPSYNAASRVKARAIDQSELAELRRWVLRPVEPRSWGVLKRGLFKGDPCYVESVDRSGRAVVWCVPRIRPPSPSKSADVSKVQGPAEEKEGRKEMEHEASVEETTKVIGSKRPLPSEDDNRPRVPRPPRVLINDQLLAESFGKRAVRKEGNGFSFRGTFYLAGLARSVVPVAHVKPSRIFSYTLYRVCAASAHIPRESVEEYAHRYATERLRPGDPVRIVQGEQRGFVATVLDINDDHADVQLKHTDLSAQIPLRLLQRVFRAGDSVVVTTGINARRWGYVVQEYAGLVTIVSPDGQDSVSLF